MYSQNTKIYTTFPASSEAIKTDRWITLSKQYNYLLFQIKTRNTFFHGAYSCAPLPQICIKSNHISCIYDDETVDQQIFWAIWDILSKLHANK